MNDTIEGVRQAVDQIQNETLAELKKYIPAGPAALVDFPSHQNAGDSLIFAGEISYLKRMGVAIDYLCDAYRYEPKVLRARVPAGPILLHGGGNFGDRWPEFQSYRERVIEDFPDRKIVMLPQSIEFSTKEALDAARLKFSRHSDLTILLRETPSLEQAVNYFGDCNKVSFCPDLAFGVGVQKAARTAKKVDIVQLLRQDSERVTRPPFQFSQSSLEVDWGLHGLDAALWKILRAPGRASKSFPQFSGVFHPAVSLSYYAQAKLNLRKASQILQSGRIVVTDRLHAAVLAGLHGQQVVALDNAYGKISSVYRAYLQKLPNVNFAESTESAVTMIEELIRRAP